MPDPFSLPFFQRGVAEVLLLALAAGLLGTWIVLRGLAFFAHAVGTATFPGLVLADGLGFSPALGAFGAALVMAGLVALLARGRRADAGSATALVLAAALALGVVLASDVFGSQARVDRLLFGSLLLIDGADLRLAGLAAVAVVGAAICLGPRWLARGFAGGERPAGRADAVLVLLIAVVAVAALAAVGALLATALLVVPAATTRLIANRMLPWQLATVALAAAEGVGGLWLAFEIDVPPGAAIAVLAGAVFVLVALARWAVDRGAVRRGPAVAAVLAGLALGLGGCGGAATSNDDGRPVVVATTTQLADVAGAIAGDGVRIRRILAPNSDPHEYEPRPRDVVALADARALLISGRGLDAWAPGLVSDAGGDATVVDVSRGLPVARPGDPHWWHDPRNMLAATRTIERALLAAAAPADRAAIARRASAYRARLRRLDRAIRACLARVPASDRRIVTDHDALGYFADRYGIRVVGAVIPAATTRAQASAGDLAALERAIRRQRVRAVFPERSVNAKLARRIAADTGASADATLYGDTLGPDGSRGGTYLGMESANTEALVRGMTGGAARCRVAA